MTAFVLIVFFIFSIALGTAAYFVWSVPQKEADQILSSRLRELRMTGGSFARKSSDLVRKEQRGTFASLGDFAQWLGVLRRLQEFIDQANLKYRAQDVFVLCVILTLVVYIALGFAGLTLFLLRAGLSLLVGAIPVLRIFQVRAKRLKRFEQHLPDAIDLFNRSMRAGHNIHAGLETIATESLNPVRMEFKKLVEELALGAPVEQALHGLGQRVPLIDLKFFVTGLILQRQTGANMVQVLESLASLVRERLNLAEKMKASTAQQRFTAAFICSLPVLLGMGYWIMKPDYFRLMYTEPTGQFLLTYAIVSEFIGILVILKLANPRF
jgi:tight adherence protein B